MLTKDLLKFKTVGDAIHPIFLEKTPSQERTATLLIEVFAAGVGGTRGALQEEIATALGGTQTQLQKAFIKILWDACEVEEPSETASALRSEHLRTARLLWESQSFVDLEDYQATLRKALPDPKSLYADLPANQAVSRIRAMDVEGLIRRYNIAQVQGLLLRASQLTLSTKVSDPIQRRRLFQTLKSHRLLADVKVEDSGMTLRLDGPMSLFDQTTAYGKRLASFLKWVPLLPNWRISAPIELRGQTYRLVLDEQSGLKTYISEWSGYLPPELATCISGFDKWEGWKVVPYFDYVHLGRQSYAFPDLLIETPRGSVIYVELFHRWHVNALASRLQSLVFRRENLFLIGVCDSIRNQKAVADSTRDIDVFDSVSFSFKEFPTARRIRDAVERLEAHH